MILNKTSLVLFIGAALTAATFLISANTDVPSPNEVRPSTVKPFTIPQSLSFAGESIPLERLDVQEKLDREILINTYWQSNNLLMLKRSAKFFPIIEPILQAHGVPDDFKYLALIESGLQNIVSPAGAAGYWQIMKTTGTEKGLEIDNEIDERYHIVKSTEVACQYLLEAHERLGSWTLAAASYNMGMSGTERRLTEQKVDSYYDLLLNSETSRYVYRIAAVKHIHENLNAFGYVFDNQYGYRFPEFDTVEVTGNVENWINWALEHGTTYNSLRTYNPWIRDDHLMGEANKTYAVWVPKK
ncbi:MAG: rane-bound lytic murein transglycosylase [Bacteroidota bacterium]|jgi:hypothetical protein